MAYLQHWWGHPHANLSPICIHIWNICIFVCICISILFYKAIYIHIYNVIIYIYIYIYVQIHTYMHRYISWNDVQPSDVYLAQPNLRQLTAFIQPRQTTGTHCGFKSLPAVQKTQEIHGNIHICHICIGQTFWAGTLISWLCMTLLLIENGHEQTCDSCIVECMCIDYRCEYGNGSIDATVTQRVPVVVLGCTWWTTSS